ncbi:MAG: hypothetical protein AAB214_07635, partial [Fibrobacterota bacterium]
WIALVVLGNLRASLPAMLYAACPRMYVAHCVNRDRPQMHCNGKCQRMRQIQSAMGVQGPALHESVPLPVENVWYLDDVLVPASAKASPNPRSLTALDGSGMAGDPDDPPPRSVVTKNV